MSARLRSKGGRGSAWSQESCGTPWGWECHVSQLQEWKLTYSAEIRNQVAIALRGERTRKLPPSRRTTA